MAPSDKTYYSVKRLHAVFAVASVALLAVTVWMLAADHRREWKRYQRTFRDRVEPWLTESRIRQEQTEQFRAAQKEFAAAVDKACAEVPDETLIERFAGQLEGDAARRKTKAPDFTPVETAYQALAAEPGPKTRAALLDKLGKLIAAAKVRHENAQRRLRFRRADFDEARTTYEGAVGEGLPQAKLDRLQQRTDRIKREVEGLAADAEAVAAHHEALTRILGEITQAEDTAREALADHRAAVEQLGAALGRQEPSLAKRLLRMPLIDAFGRPLAVDQIWLPELTIDYNFRQVARFDRCVTCHQAIAKTAPGSATEPACRSEQVLTVELDLGSEENEDDEEAEEENQDSQPGPSAEPTLETVLGLVLAPRGILDPRTPTVGMVMPRTPAAGAKLLVGDVILKVGDHPVNNRAEATERLLAFAATSTPRRVAIEIRRGLPHPYSSHPRLDLFVGSLSPHPMTDFGCTICHDGQGSATEFKFASHAPNDCQERDRWRKQHGWFPNPHWDFPMLPERFVQSSCLKCHHDVTDLAPSERFRRAPAPKLLTGYHLVRQSGCFGCHEIKGVTESQRRIGPDMRLEPNYSAAALELLSDPGLTDRQRSLAEEQPAPGTMRKVGPTLRGISGKLEAPFIRNWIGGPADFLPSTRMPQFFGMHEHLEGKSLADAKRFEAVEIAAVTDYLLSASPAVELLQPPPGVTEPPSATRGKRLFRTHGCVACHRHKDFPKGQSVTGRDLSNIGAKFTTEAGARWLTAWIRDPSHVSPRTLMPNTLLEPIPLAETEEKTDQPEKGGNTQATPDGKSKPRMTDPAADISAYLLSCKGWQPKKPPPWNDSDLDELALLHLGKTFSKTAAQRYLKEGIPKSTSETLSGDAVELSGKISRRKKLLYVGRRTIRKRGCFGCHDVPGLEDAQPIGPALSDWGRKQESLLAFGQVHQFLAAGSRQQAAGSKQSDDVDRGFFIDAVLAGRREGFIWQKLNAPRSFDYRTTQNKSYNERLTMGRFALTAGQREAIITFVLGLVAEPPAEKYVYSPGVRRKAIVEGLQVLDRYACAECHTLAMERWTFEYDPERFQPPEAAEDSENRQSDFLKPRISAEELAASTATDNRGLARAEVVGMPQLDAQGNVLVLEGDEEDEEGEPLPMFSFSLWEPAAINGRICTVGGADALIYRHQITKERPATGGAFARLLYPVVSSEAKAAGANFAAVEPWGWVPPPLVHEGSTVRPQWLHDYLLEPTQIRPAAVLRMPKCTLSSAEAGKLVDYFAAVAGVDFPYSSRPPSPPEQLAAKEKQRPHRLDDAMRILVDRNTYCAKCHLIGDYGPGGETRTVLAPRLDQVGRRIRPEYVRRWLANPKSALPYTGMPVNFPPTGPLLGQELYTGSSIEQLEAVVDLLLNYDWYMHGRTSIKSLAESIKQEEPPAKAGADHPQEE